MEDVARFGHGGRRFRGEQAVLGILDRQAGRGGQGEDHYVIGRNSGTDTIYNYDDDSALDSVVRTRPMPAQVGQTSDTEKGPWGIAIAPVPWQSRFA